MRVYAIVGIVLAVVGCRSTPDLPIRTATGNGLIVNTSAEELADPNHRRDAALASIERHPHFTLAVIELSDEGLIWNEEQRNAVFQEAADVVKKHNAGAITVTFVHGWRHNGSLCDDNVACFRSVLESLYASEDNAARNAHRTARPVIGFYLAWRGLAACDQPAVLFSIWTRKRVDQGLGAAQARAVLAQIMRLHAKIRLDYPDSHSRLVMAGHSLGAGVLFAAVAPLARQGLHDAIREATNGATLTPHGRRFDLGLIKDFGKDVDGAPIAIPDLIVLVNPAFEAELYKRIPRDLSYMAKYNIHFAENQWPIMVTISSPADWATRWIFPLGQSLFTITTPTIFLRGPLAVARNIMTPPKYPPYVTDSATTLIRGDSSQHKSKAASSCFQGDAVKLAVAFGGGCGCAELLPAAVAATRAEIPADVQIHGRRVGLVDLVHLQPDVDQSNPFLVVRADAKLLSSHDDIYNATFLTFLEGLLSDVDVKKQKENR